MIGQIVEVDSDRAIVSERVEVIEMASSSVRSSSSKDR